MYPLKNAWRRLTSYRFSSGQSHAQTTAGTRRKPMSAHDGRYEHRSEVYMEGELKDVCKSYGSYADGRYGILQTVVRECEKLRLEKNVSETTLREIKDVLLSIPKRLDDCKDDKGNLRSLSIDAGDGCAVAAITGFPNQRKRKRALQNATNQGFKWADEKEQQKIFSLAWNRFLMMELPTHLLKEVLEKLSSHVMPYLVAPLTLCDFLTSALDRGDDCALLALNGIFFLMTKHNLEYPEFYKTVYGLLTDETLHRTDGRKFLELLDIFLKSGWVPAYTQAAFIKRFARLALRAAPRGAMICITFIHNLIRQHPACYIMLDRQSVPNVDCSFDSWKRFDCYDESEVDPAYSRAIESSLWEIDALGNHWCQAVCLHAECLLQDLTKRSRTRKKKFEDILYASYSTMIQQNLRSKETSKPSQTETMFPTEYKETLFE